MQRKKNVMEFEANIAFKEKTYFIMVMRMSSNTHPLWRAFKSPIGNANAGADNNMNFILSFLHSYYSEKHSQMT